MAKQLNLVLFGASGMVGSRVLAEALRRGHQVKAVARNPQKISEVSDRLVTVAGSILNFHEVEELSRGADAVISAFGPGAEGYDKIVDAAKSLISGVRAAGVKRIIQVGGAGGLEVSPGVQLMHAPGFNPDWAPPAEAHEKSLQVFKTEAGDLDWTVLSPAALIQPGERTGHFRLGGGQLITDEDGNSRISAEDFAVALIDEVENPAHIQSRFTLAY